MVQGLLMIWHLHAVSSMSILPLQCERSPADARPPLLLACWLSPLLRVSRERQDFLQQLP